MARRGKSIATKRVGNDYAVRKALENVQLTGQLCEQSRFTDKLERDGLIVETMAGSQSASFTLTAAGLEWLQK